ncbi:AMT1-1 [Symbiodinium natans]|uniref:AMT1-1 protein n=1 Tax=Symbiodinium natans TaxID=878477 RepID=A0A812JVL3_9DINO|nr:AMT1-1 [Symbiodinium natans]
MQIKRFQLFREDVRDLVELTVGKMEMYHVVGALVLECTVIYYTEGRIRTSSPPFLLGLYWLSAAGTFIYVLLCVWFSMYASISSHSFGVRLLTRFVRLPIPGSQQINALNARLTDFERQGKKIMRIPFSRDVPQWQQRRDLKDQPDPRLGKGEGDENFLTAVVKPGAMKQQDLLEEGVQAYQDDEVGLQQAAQNLPGKHVRLFRELQAKWQCYDAYARVSMSLGVNHICMTMSYYVIGLTVLEYRSPSIMFALVLVFQATNLALAWLDVAGLKRKTISSLELLGSVPPFITCISMVSAPYLEGGRGQFDPNHEFVLGCVAFFITAIWLEGLLHLAWPSADLVMLPKRFRSVLFLDVFGVADDIKQEAHHSQQEDERSPIHEISREEAEAADTAVSDAEAAVRRWAELPDGTVEEKDIKETLESLRSKVLMWRKAGVSAKDSIAASSSQFLVQVLNGEAARRASARGDTADLDVRGPEV